MLHSRIPISVVPEYMDRDNGVQLNRMEFVKLGADRARMLGSMFGLLFLVDSLTYGPNEIAVPNKKGLLEIFRNNYHFEKEN